MKVTFCEKFLFFMNFAIISLNIKDTKKLYITKIDPIYLY